MKKLTSLILTAVALLAFASCTPQMQITAKHDYDIYPNTDWGMSKDDVITALKLNSDDYDENNVNSLNPGDYGFTVNQKMFGQDATVEFLFFDKFKDSTIDIGLYLVSVKIQADAAVLEEVTAKLEEQFIESDKIHKRAETTREKRIVTNSSSTDLKQIGNKYLSKLTVETIANSDIREKAIEELKNISSGMAFEKLPITEVWITHDSKTNEIKVLYSGLHAAIANNA